MRYQLLKNPVARQSMIALLMMLLCIGSFNSYAQTIPSIPLPLLGEKRVQETPSNQVLAMQQSVRFYAQNPVYRQIAEAVISRGLLSSEHQLLGVRYNHEAHRRSLLPRVTPSASVDDLGNLIGRLQIEQIIYDGGRFRSGHRLLSAEQAIAFADLSLQFNTRVGRAIDSYLRYNRNTELLAVSRDINERYEALRNMAERRLTGGVGSKSELGLFQLKHFEALTTLAQEQAETAASEAELESFIGENIATNAPIMDINTSPDQLPPVVAQAIAEQSRSQSQLSAEHAERLPSLSVRSSLGRGSSQGLGFNDRLTSHSLGVQLSKPLTWGRDYGLKAARAEVGAAQAMVTEVRQDTDRQLRSFTLRISALFDQLELSDALLAQARTRTEEFEQLFLGGSATIVEAVAIIDTYNRIKRNQIELRHSLLTAQREKVELLGLLGPFQSPTRAASSNY